MLKKNEIWQRLFSLLIILLLSGCASESRVTNNIISQQAAIDTALKIVSISRPEISGSQVTPFNIHAEQMTLGEAIKRISAHSDVASGYTPDMLVWLVTMDGVWLDEFPQPSDLPTPKPYSHSAIIIDAKTGFEIESSTYQ